MTLSEAIHLISPGVTSLSGTWADIGAGTGLFTQALMEILTEGKVIALDKSPHALYQDSFQSKVQNLKSKIQLEIREADFHHPMDLPPLDGILMANSLHYATDHLFVLKNVLTSLKPGGTLILIEYDTNTPNYPWVPNPVPLVLFKSLCQQAELSEPVVIARHQSIYSDGDMYVALALK